MTDSEYNPFNQQVTGNPLVPVAFNFTPEQEVSPLEKRKQEIRSESRGDMSFNDYWSNLGQVRHDSKLSTKIGKDLKHGSQFMVNSINHLGANIPFDVLRMSGVPIKETLLSPTGLNTSANKSYTEFLMKDIPEAATSYMLGELIGGGMSRIGQMKNVVGEVVNVPTRAYDIYYHGSPWKWKKFNPTSLGKGEGASKRGIGLNLFPENMYYVAPKFANIRSADAPIHLGKSRPLSSIEKLFIRPTIYEFKVPKDFNLKNMNPIDFKNYNQLNIIKQGYKGVKTSNQVTIFPEFINDVIMSKRMSINKFVSSKPNTEWVPWSIKQNTYINSEGRSVFNTGKNLIKPVSKVVGKTDDAIKAGSKVLNKTDDVVKPIVSSVYDVAYPVTRTTPNSGYTFKTISPNKKKIAIHESNKYHDVMWVAKNDIDNFFINNKIDVSKLPESKLVGSEVGYDWILPEGITHDMLNEFARLHHGKPITQEMRNIAKAIKEANPNVKFSGTSHELHGIASNIHPDYLGKFGQGLSNVDKAGSKVLNKEEALSKLSNENKINLSETFNNLTNKSKNISENLSYELNTLPKKLNPSYQKRAKKELEYANKWQEEWYNHPETMKRLQSLSDEFNTYRNQQIDLINKENKILRENPDNLKLGYTQEDLNNIFRDIPYNTENEWTKIIKRINDKNYVSTFQSKDAKLQKILKGEERTHKGNYGVSGHYLDKDYSGVRQNLVDKYSSEIKSTAIHEGNHGLTEGNRFIPKSEQKEMVKIFGQDKQIPVRNEKGEFNNYDEYLEDPTEIYARIMELRKYMRKKPGELVSADEVEKLIQFGKNENTPVDPYFFSKIQDKEKLKKLFNRLPVIAPLFGISYLQSQQNKTVMNNYQKGGRFLPNWNKVKTIVNPKNWGVPDYTDKGDFDTAYSTAKKAGEKEFMWNNKRYSTKYAGTVQEEVKSYFPEYNVVTGVEPGSYVTTALHIIDKSKSSKWPHVFTGDLNKKTAIDYPTGYNYSELGVSAYDDTKYYASKINTDSIYDEISKMIENNNAGEYDFIDNNCAGAVCAGLDLPYGKLPLPSTVPMKLKLKYPTIELTSNVTDSKELSNLYNYFYSDSKDSLLNTNINTLEKHSSDNYLIKLLQKALFEKGYKLPESTQQYGIFDGILGDETKNALLDYQTKNKTKVFKKYPSLKK